MWKTTPSIVIEDVDSQRITRLGSLKSPVDLSFDNEVITASPRKERRRSSAAILPEVDGYVTPLSLCHPETPLTDSQSETVLAIPSYNFNYTSTGPLTPGYSETSFTSVDIGSNPFSFDHSWASDCSSHQGDTGCFDIRSGMLCVTKVVTGVPVTSSSPHNEMINQRMLELASSDTQKKSSLITIFIIIVAVIALIAAGVAIYVELVAKPSVGIKQHEFHLNETSICDLLINSCETSNHEITNNFNSVSASAEASRIQATFSSSFKNQINNKFQKKE